MALRSKAAVPLTPFQRAWIGDTSRFKMAAKARRIGFTFATTLEIALDAIERRTRWLIVSRTQDTAKEAVREISNHFRAMKKVAEASAPIVEQETDLFFENMRINKFVIELPNGSEISALTAHPDAARGFGGNVFLDEHGFHRDSKELWKGAAAAVLRGHRLLVVSTPHYQTGNYFEKARGAGLTTGKPPEQRQNGIWSSHWVDIHRAVPELAEIGVPIDLDELRELAGDEETWNQEFCCQFLSAAEMWIPLELIAGARSPQAVTTWDPNREYEGWLFIGGDIGRKRDATQVWIDEVLRTPLRSLSPEAPARGVPSADVAYCRGLITMIRTPFEQQLQTLRTVIAHPKVRRACLDASGLGMMLVEQLQKEFGLKVEGITFTREIKENMAVRVRRRMEEKLDRIPENCPEIERDFAAIKRETTASGNLRFDADRTENSHADIFWAKALADLAADSGVAAASAGRDPEVEAWRDPANRRPTIWEREELYA